MVEFLAILMALMSKREEERWDFDCWRKEGGEGEESIGEKGTREKARGERREELLGMWEVFCPLQGFHLPIP